MSRDFQDTGRPRGLRSGDLPRGGPRRSGRRPHRIISDHRPTAGHKAVSVRVIEGQPAITLVHRHPPGARVLPQPGPPAHPVTLAPGLALPLQAGRTSGPGPRHPARHHRAASLSGRARRAPAAPTTSPTRTAGPPGAPPFNWPGGVQSLSALISTADPAPRPLLPGLMPDRGLVTAAPGTICSAAPHLPGSPQRNAPPRSPKMAEHRPRSRSSGPAGTDPMPGTYVSVLVVGRCRAPVGLSLTVIAGG